MLMYFGPLIMITTDHYMQLREIMLFDQLDLSTGLTGQNCRILLGYPKQGNIDSQVHFLGTFAALYQCEELTD